jgi:hypothetical protein
LFNVYSKGPGTTNDERCTMNVFAKLLTTRDNTFITTSTLFLGMSSKILSLAFVLHEGGVTWSVLSFYICCLSYLLLNFGYNICNE